jgi:hypothetical protein
MIEEKALLSGLTKKDFMTRSCINSKICVVGSMENIRYILDAIKEMRYSLIEIAERLSSEKLAEGGGNAGEPPLSNDTLIEMSLRYAILCSIIVDILDSSAYLFDKEAPERVSTCEKLAHLEELIASVEKDGVEGIQTEVGKNSLDDG